MKFIFICLFCLFSFLNASGLVRASVTILPLCKSDKNIDDFPFIGGIENVNNHSSGSGTVIGDGSFVLTSKHLITHDGSKNGMLLDGSNFVFRINGRLFKVEKIYAHSFADIAILKIDGVFDKIAKLSFSSYFMGTEFYGVGFGKSSTNPSYKKIEWDINYGTKRVYKNTISDQSIDFNKSNSLVQIEKSLIFTLKDPCSLGESGGAILGEGMHGPGDSGGGIFVIEDHELHIFGVISAITIKAPIKGIITDLFQAKDWISNIVPEAYASQKKQNTYLQLNGASAFGLVLLFDNKKCLFMQNTRRKRKIR